MPPSHAVAMGLAVTNLAQSRAMAELLALLSSGENTAADAFFRLAQVFPEEECKLLAIVADEERHGKMVATMRATLPVVPSDTPFLRRQKRFFCSLAEGDLAARFAAIFAVDSALCLMLSLLRHSKSTIVAPYRNAIASIHRDEARHAALTHGWSRQLGDPRHNSAVMRSTRSGLIELLQCRSDAFAAIDISPDDLFCKLARASDA